MRRRTMSCGFSCQETAARTTCLHSPPLRTCRSVISKAGVRTLLSKRAFIALLLLAWIPFLVRAVQIYAATNLPQAAFLAPDARMFRQFLEQQEVFLFFIT